MGFYQRVCLLAAHWRSSKRTVPFLRTPPSCVYGSAGLWVHRSCVLVFSELQPQGVYSVWKWVGKFSSQPDVLWSACHQSTLSMNLHSVDPNRLKWINPALRDEEAILFIFVILKEQRVLPLVPPDHCIRGQILPCVFLSPFYRPLVTLLSILSSYSSLPPLSIPLFSDFSPLPLISSKKCGAHGA